MLHGTAGERSVQLQRGESVHRRPGNDGLGHCPLLRQSVRRSDGPDENCQGGVCSLFQRRVLVPMLDVGSEHDAIQVRIGASELDVHRAHGSQALLAGARLKHISLVAGLVFASLLVVQQASIFMGDAGRTGSWILDRGGGPDGHDLWVMDDSVEMSEDNKPLLQTSSRRVRSPNDFRHRLLRVRVDIDENEAWRVRTGAEATASLRGNSSKVYELDFGRIEPYVIPKRSLTGLSTERVDTRVLQVIYRLSAASGDATPYPGQQVDVFIEAAAR